MGFGSDIGGAIGSNLGDWGQKLLGFKKGGKIPGKKGKARLIVAHGGEFVLPLGIAPTKAQKSGVAKRHKK